MDSEINQTQVDDASDLNGSQPPAPAPNAVQAPQSQQQAPREKKVFGSFTLFDNFAICHYDLEAAKHRPDKDKRLLCAVKVGHVLRKGYKDTQSKSPAVRKRGAYMMEQWDQIIRESMLKVYEQHQIISDLFEQDPIAHGELFHGEGKTFDIHWNDPRFFFLIRMVIMVDEANTKLRKLHSSGFIDHATLKRKQKNLAQPLRAALHGINSLAGKIHRQFKESEQKAAAQSAPAAAPEPAEAAPAKPEPTADA